MNRPFEGPQQPHTALKVVEPGTPEHEAWRQEQARKRGVAEHAFLDNGKRIGRPEGWR